MTRSVSHSTPEITILRALLESKGGFVSGGRLAKTLGMSRVAIWQHMEKLRAQGFAFEAVRARGYRLTARPAGLNPALVEAHIAPRRLAFGFDCFDSIDSTNDEASRQLADCRATPFVIAARRQTRGRGRFGRVWHSEAGGNLYLSFAFRPLVTPDRMQTFTLWMGVNICELILSFARVTPGLKWPNDILFDGRKAGGMLTEARIDSDQIRDLVFGLGLNINGASAELPHDVARRAASIAESARAELDLNKFAAAIIGRVLDAYEQFISGRHRDTFADSWHKFDCLKGRPISLLHGTERKTGIATGIDDEGALLLRNSRDRLERFRAGEVTIEKQPLT